MCEAPEHVRKEPEYENPLALNACKHCGQILPEGRIWCDDCYAENRIEKDRENVGKAQVVREQMRIEGRDPAHDGDAAKKWGTTQRELQRLNREWEANPTHGMSELDYRRDVLPRIADVPARVIARAIGVSNGYASEMRKGQNIPHARHWVTLTALGTSVTGDSDRTAD